MGWTPKIEEALKKLWAEGLSASQIAGRLGSVTRNAVIGKVHRLGLSGRATRARVRPSKPRKPQGKTKDHRVPRQKNQAEFANVRSPALRALYESTAPHVEPQEELVIPEAQRKSLGALEDHMCHWPIGDPQKPGFHFCGKQKVDGLPYCEFHARRAYQPPSVTRSKQEQAEKAFEKG